MVVYSATPFWFAGLVVWVPVIGWLIGFAALVYTGYQIYLGSQATSKVPQDKAVGFTIILIPIWIVTFFVVEMILTSMLINILFTGALGPAVIYG